MCAMLCDPDIDMIVLGGCKSGPEPSIRSMLIAYYMDRGFSRVTATTIVTELLEKQDEICQQSLKVTVPSEEDELTIPESIYTVREYFRNEVLSRADTMSKTMNLKALEDRDLPKVFKNIDNIIELILAKGSSDGR